MPTNTALAKIHIGKKVLGLSTEAYRDIMIIRYNKDSAAKLSQHQAVNLIEHFKSLGWKPRRKKNSIASPKYDDPMMRKVVALWITLHRSGVVRNPSDKALQAYVKRMSGVDNLKWCNAKQLGKLIEGLKSMAKRKGVTCG